jgi:hypothetical protein
MRVSWYCLLATVAATLPCGEFLMGTAYSFGFASSMIGGFEIPHWVAAVFVGAALHRTHALFPAQVVFGLVLFSLQKHIADTNAANGYMRPWGGTQTFLHFCSCLFAAIVTSLATAWIASLMYPAKTNTSTGDSITS